MLAQAGAQALQGVMGIATSLIGGRARRQEMEEAQQGFDKARRRMENLDTSNLYSNIAGNNSASIANVSCACSISGG